MNILPKFTFISVFALISCIGDSRDYPDMAFGDSVRIHSFQYQVPNKMLESTQDFFYFTDNNYHHALFRQSGLHSLDSQLTATSHDLLLRNRGVEIDCVVNILQVDYHHAMTPQFAMSIINSIDSTFVIVCSPAHEPRVWTLSTQSKLKSCRLACDAEFASLFRDASDVACFYIAVWKPGLGVNRYVVETVNAMEYSREALDFMSDEEYDQTRQIMRVIKGCLNLMRN